MKEPLGAADVGIAALEEAQKFAGGAGDADAHAFADGADAMVDFAEPECFVFAEIHAVMAAIDLQRLREAARPAREIEEFGAFAMALHDFDAFERLESANQDGRSGFGRLADDVEHEMRAIVEENIDVAGSEIHGFDARRGPAEMMPGGIARRIRFGLNDAAADATGGKFVHHDFADEETRKLDGVRGKLGAANAADGDFLRFLEGGGGHWGGHSRIISAGQNFLKIIRGKQIVIFAVAVQEAGDVRTHGNHAQMVGAGKIERRARELCGYSVAFDRRGHFRMVEHDAVRKEAIG